MKELENHVADGDVTQAAGRSSTAAHTPGPWDLRADPYEDGLPYFHITAGDWRTENWERMGFRIDVIAREPDARLIAAAPELLASLKTVMGFINTDSRFDDFVEMQTARAAIAKAEGRS